MWKYVFGIPAALIVFVFTYYAISPLFRSVVVDEAVPQGTFAPEVKMDEEMPEAQAARPPAAPPAFSASAEVIGTLGHPASGTARIVEADGKVYLRYENFKTINGPDLFVYLAKDTNATEFINLGALKATEGNVNYEIPTGVDPREYPYALVWCRAFSVLFNSAKVF